MKKQIVSIFLCCCLIAALFPATVSADSTDSITVDGACALFSKRRKHRLCGSSRFRRVCFL